MRQLLSIKSIRRPIAPGSYSCAAFDLGESLALCHSADRPAEPGQLAALVLAERRAGGAITNRAGCAGERIGGNLRPVTGFTCALALNCDWILHHHDDWHFSSPADAMMPIVESPMQGATFVASLLGVEARVTYDLDKLDVRLLNLLQTNNLATADELSRDVPLSPSAITRRIRRLRDAGLILQDAAILAPAMLRGWVRGLVLIRLRENRFTGELAGLRRCLAETPHVQICFELTGPFDVGVILVARDLQCFNRLVDEVIGGHPAVERFETSYFKLEIKNSTSVLLDEEEARLAS